MVREIAQKCKLVEYAFTHTFILFYYGFIMTASWEKIYSVLGGVAKRRSPVRNIFSPDAVIIFFFFEFSFVSRSSITRINKTVNKSVRA